jgi:uncharacterized membrane protein YgcG
MCLLRKLNRALIISGCFALCACASAEQQHQADANACQGYGFAEGTPEFANCMQQEQIARSQRGGVYPSIGIGVGGGSYGGGGFGGGGIGFGF